MTLLLPWVLAGLFLLAAVFFMTRARSEVTSRDARELALAQLERELVASRDQLERASRAQRQKGDELAEMRRKLEKAKKRAAHSLDAKRSEPGRIAELEDALGLAREDLGASREQVLELEAQVSRLRARAQQPQPQPQPAPPPPPDPAPVEGLKQRAEKAEVEAERLGGELTRVREELSRSEAKVETSRKLYLAIRGELGVKKDRLNAQQEELERLRALKVAIVDPLPEEVPLSMPASPREAPAVAAAPTPAEGGESTNS